MSIRDAVSRCALAIGLFLGGDLSASAAPAITLLPLVGPPKTKLVISGTGFDPTQLIDIYFDTTDFCLAASDALGAFSCTINVPSSAQPQNHWITAAERVNGLAAQKAFTVRTDWPQFHGRDAKHTGYNKFEKPSRRPTFLILIFYGENRLECLERKVRRWFPAVLLMSGDWMASSTPLTPRPEPP